MDGTNGTKRRLMVSDLVMVGGLVACLSCGGAGGGCPIEGDRELAPVACEACQDGVAACDFCGENAVDAIDTKGEVDSLVCAECKAAVESVRPGVAA